MNPIQSLFSVCSPICASKQLQNRLISDLEEPQPSGLYAGNLNADVYASLQNLSLFDLGMIDTGAYMSPGLITLVNIYARKQMWIGLFCMSAGTCFPLHDHPDMICFTRLLTGDINLRKVDIIGSYHGITDAQVVSNCEISSPAFTYLSPNQANVHEIHAIEDSILMDVFIPNYSLSRVCTYFEELQSANGLLKLRAMKQPNIPCQEKEYVGMPPV